MKLGQVCVKFALLSESLCRVNAHAGLVLFCFVKKKKTTVCGSIDELKTSK